MIHKIHQLYTLLSVGHNNSKTVKINYSNTNNKRLLHNEINDRQKKVYEKNLTEEWNAKKIIKLQTAIKRKKIYSSKQR